MSSVISDHRLYRILLRGIGKAPTLREHRVMMRGDKTVFDVHRYIQLQTVEEDVNYNECSLYVFAGNQSSFIPNPQQTIKQLFESFGTLGVLPHGNPEHAFITKNDDGILVLHFSFQEVFG